MNKHFTFFPPLLFNHNFATDWLEVRNVIATISFHALKEKEYSGKKHRKKEKKTDF